MRQARQESTVEVMYAFTAVEIVLFFGQEWVGQQALVQGCALPVVPVQQFWLSL